MTASTSEDSYFTVTMRRGRARAGRHVPPRARCGRRRTDPAPIRARPPVERRACVYATLRANAEVAEGTKPRVASTPWIFARSATSSCADAKGSASPDAARASSREPRAGEHVRKCLVGPRREGWVHGQRHRRGPTGPDAASQHLFTPGPHCHPVHAFTQPLTHAFIARPAHNKNKLDDTETVVSERKQRLPTVNHEFQPS